MAVTIELDWRAHMVPPVSSKLWLVFRGGYEYVFTDGEAAMLTVTLSTTAITVFDRHNVHADDLATHAAEWAIFIHRANGAVDFGEANDLLKFCQYYFHYEKLEKRAC